uniref:Major facilitator superfamily (MFS) profile domain-containing protein n=1 Tax=Oryza punctata TaxID=4537 RepID=A0A0E0L0T1_ORYPU
MLTAMVAEGSMQCLSLAYVADKVPPSRRAAAFGVFSGVCLAGFVAGTVAARLLTVQSTFQVAAVAAVAAAVYMRAFVKETDGGASLLRAAAAAGDEENSSSHPLCVPSRSSSSNEDVAPPTLPPLRKALSLSDMADLLTTSSTFSREALVIFFYSLGETGLQTAILYFLKAQFHYSKNQYANLLLVIGIAGSLSQVPYLGASFVIISILVNPCGMVQGCLTGISSTANVISPIVFTPLTAWFLSETAPFNFRGFSLACAGFAMFIALTVSINMRPAELQPDSK